MTATDTMTAEEFLVIAYRDRPRFSQLVDGEVVVNAPSFLHGALQGRLYIALTEWIASPAGRGSVHLPADVLVDERNVYQPDLLFYGKAQDLRSPAPYDIPEIVAEVRSPGTWRYDIGAKKVAYERNGLRELWLVDTVAEGLLVFRRSSQEAAGFDECAELAAGDTLTSPQLEGFALGVGELFSV